MKLSTREKFIILKASFAGAKQAAQFYSESKKFWENYRPRLAKELSKELSLSDFELASRSKSFAIETSTPSLECSEQEISELKKKLKQKNYSLEKLAEDFSIRANSLQFSQLILMPALAYSRGLGDLDEDSTKHWLIGIGINYPLSSDAADDFLDWDFPPHSVADYESLGTFYKLIAPLLLNIGKKHFSIPTTGKPELDNQLLLNLNSSLRKVGEFNKKDLEAQKRKDVSIEELHEIYDGKIGEIEAAVFSSIPSNRRDIVEIFADGARALAIVTQIKDDFDDILGDQENKLKPKVPNPSFFLTFFRNRWRSGEKNFPEVFGNAASDSYNIALKHFEKVNSAYNRLPDDFKTKPFFKSINAFFLHKLKENYEKVLEAKTLPELIPQLQDLL